MRPTCAANPCWTGHRSSTHLDRPVSSDSGALGHLGPCCPARSQERRRARRRGRRRRARKRRWQRHAVAVVRAVVSTFTAVWAAPSPIKPPLALCCRPATVLPPPVASPPVRCAADRPLPTVAPPTISPRWRRCPSHHRAWAEGAHSSSQHMHGYKGEQCVDG